MNSTLSKPRDASLTPDFKLYGLGGGPKESAKLAQQKHDSDVMRSLNENLKVEVVSQQKKPAPNPTKQPKYIVNKVPAGKLNNNLSSIVNCVSRGQRSNIDDFTKGHLNERHLQPIFPAQLGDVELNWGVKYSKPLAKDKQKARNTELLTRRKPDEYNKMSFALQEFVMRTSGANNLLTTVFENEKVSVPRTSSAKFKRRDHLLTEKEESVEREKDAEVIGEDRNESFTSEDLGIYDADDSTIMGSSNRQDLPPRLQKVWNLSPRVEEVKPGELKLPRIVPFKKPSKTPTPPGTPGKGGSQFLTSHFYGATKKDQFSDLLGFQSKVMNFDSKEVKLVSNSMAAKYYKDKLKKLLTSLPSKSMRSMTPNLDKVFAHGRIWEDLIKDSPIFGPVLAAIKTEYDSYLRHLAISERRKLESGSLESEVTGLLTANVNAQPGHFSSFGENREDRGGDALFDNHDVTLEEQQRINEMEAEIELLMDSNQSLHEEIKSAKRRIEAHRETKRRSLFAPDSPKEAWDENGQENARKKSSRSEVLLGLREAIMDTMDRIEAIKSEMKQEMVPASLTRTIEQLTKQDQKSIERYSETCERVIEMSTQIGKEFNDELGKSVISPVEIKMLWRKLKTMNVVGKYILNSERPVFSSEGTFSSESTNQMLVEAVDISQSDIEAVGVEQKLEEQQTVGLQWPESSRREDFDFYF